MTITKLSPRELREYKPRLRFNWRCENCDSTWTGGVTTAYCCGLYAVEVEDEADEIEFQEAAE